MQRPVFACAFALSLACGSAQDNEIGPPTNTDAGSDATDEATLPESGTSTESGTTTVGCDSCLVFVGAQLFDGHDTRPGTLVVRDDRIESVVYDEVDVVAGDVIDLTGSTLLPGFFDLHVHTPAYAGPYGYYSDAWHVDANLRSMLRNGVTSFLDLGSDAAMIFALRDRIRSGKMRGPRMHAAGPMFTATGGHPCYAGLPPSDACRLVDDATEATTAAQGLLTYEPDVIKVIIESGSSSYPLPEISADALLAIGAVAAASDLDVYAHVNETQDVTKALDAGIRVMAHMPVADLIPPSVADRMADEGVTVIPTAEVYDALARIAKDELELDGLEDDVPAEVLEALRDPDYLEPSQTADHVAFYGAWREALMHNLGVLRTAGVRIATGTDAGNPATFFGVGVLREMRLYVEAGYTPAEALAAGTVHPADLLGRSDLGRLEPGALADLVAVMGDPAEDIDAVLDVHRVWLAGAEIDRDAMSQLTPKSLIVEPVAGAVEGAVCLHEEECADGLVCASGTCLPFCSTTVLCDVGSACVAASLTSWDGYCLEGDGCDPIEQGCENGAACIWVGNAATLCWYAGIGTAGEPCSDFGTCAPGYQCAFASNKCVQLCDPGASDNPCNVPGEQCVDHSGEAGVTVGECG